MTNGMRRASVLVWLALAMAGCATSPAHRRSDNVDAVAEVFAKTAALVFSEDWIESEVPVERKFSREELRILGDHRAALYPMLDDALGCHEDSVYGAMLAGHFKYAELLDRLQYHFLVPKTCYGWEGPDYASIEDYLGDEQFQYSSAYLEAIEAITGKPVADTIVLTDEEAREIERQAANPEFTFHYWALWIRRKLRLDDGVEQGPMSNEKGPSCGHSRPWLRNEKNLERTRTNRIPLTGKIPLPYLFTSFQTSDDVPSGFFAQRFPRSRAHSSEHFRKYSATSFGVMSLVSS